MTTTTRPRLASRASDKTGTPRLRAVALGILLAGLLGGCAAEMTKREGVTLLDQGRYEEGLQKLSEAAKAEPDDMSYRIALKQSREQAVTHLLAEATEARVTDRRDVARADYRRVLGIEPENQRAADGLKELDMDERHAKIVAEAEAQFRKGQLEAARATLKSVLLENEYNREANALQRRIDERLAEQQVAASSLKGQFRRPVTLQFRDASIKTVFDALSRSSGINVLLDKDVMPDLKVSIFVQDVSAEDAIDLILMQSHLAKKVISENAVFVYPNTPAKRDRYEDLMVRSFHLTNADPKKIMTMLKTILKAKDVFVNEKTNSVVMRDSPDAIRLAEKMIADQDIPEPEVMMEVEVLEVSRTRLTDLGIKWPDQLSLTAIGTGVAPGVAAAVTGPTLNELRRINGSKIVTSPAMSVALKAMLQDTDTNILASPRIRARNREKAKIMIGDRVPVITNAVTPVSTGLPVVTGNVQYIDVGLKLEVEPDIRLDNEVAIKINLDVSSIVKEVQNTTSGTLAYQVGTRNASTLLQLKDGETQILAGLINNEQRNSAAKVPGLGQLPVLGHLFSDHNDNGAKTEVILSITPHVVGKVHQPEASEVEFWSGTEANVDTRPMLLKRARPAAGKTPAGAAPLLSGTRDALPATPLVLAWQGPKEAKVGDKISLTLNTQSDQAVRGLGFMVGYDPKVFRALDVIEGSFLAQGKAPSRFTKVIDQSSGRILVDLSSTSPAGVTGTGSVAAILFDVTQAANQSTITTTNILPRGAGANKLAVDAPPPYVISVMKRSAEDER